MSEPRSEFEQAERVIRVDPRYKHAKEAAQVLCLLGAADRWLPSWLMVPKEAVWSLNGEPQVPALSGSNQAPRS